MENTKDFNLFYINDKELPLKILVTSSLGEGKYNEEEINIQIEKLNQVNKNGKLIIYKDDGENFWDIESNNKLEIGSKEDNYAKWDEIKSKTLSIDVEDLIVFCAFRENNLRKNHKIK